MCVYSVISPFKATVVPPQHTSSVRSLKKKKKVLRTFTVVILHRVSPPGGWEQSQHHTGSHHLLCTKCQWIPPYDLCLPVCIHTAPLFRPAIHKRHAWAYPNHTQCIWSRTELLRNKHGWHSQPIFMYSDARLCSILILLTIHWLYMLAGVHPTINLAIGFSRGLILTISLLGLILSFVLLGSILTIGFSWG